MRSNAPALLPILRSRTQGELLCLVYIDPKREWSISEIASELDTPLTSVQSEAQRLINAEILTSRKIGRTRLVRANDAHPLAGPLSQLILFTFGPRLVIAEEFSPCNPARLIIFGSWAARLEGEFGAPPGDIDVLVVGDEVNRQCVYAAAERAESRLSQPVNPVIRTSRAWANSGADPLLSEVLTNPHVEIHIPNAGQGS